MELVLTIFSLMYQQVDFATISSIFGEDEV